MKKERKNEAIWHIFRKGGVLMAVCGDMSSADENELYDEIDAVLQSQIASAVEARENKIREVISNYSHAVEVTVKGQKWLRLVNGKEIPFGYPYPDTREKYIVREILAIINPSKG